MNGRANAFGLSRFLSMVVLLALLLGPGVGIAGAAPGQAGAKHRTITIQAVIDGRSQLILRGNTARWYHLDFAAPGRLEFTNDPAVINGKEWFPTWPDVPDAENRDCHCYSSLFRGVTPALPHTAMTVQMDVLQARGQVTLLQAPEADNGYTIIVDFDDDPQGGSAVYEVVLDIAFGH